MAADKGKLCDGRPLLALQHSIKNLTGDQRCEDWNISGSILKFDQPENGIQQRRSRLAHDNPTACCSIPLRRVPFDDIQNDLRGEIQLKAEVRHLRRCLRDFTDNGQMNRSDQIAGRIIGIAFIAYGGCLGTLHDNA
ncbi:hypothetical protein D3C75_1085260 [compost metagenome]